MSLFSGALRVSLACALVGGLGAVPALADGPPAQEGLNEGRVVQVKRALRGAIAPSTTWGAVFSGSVVGPQDTLKTGDESAAELVFASGARLTLGAQTVWRAVAIGEGLGRVMTGRVKFVAPPKGGATLWAGEASIRGTDAEAVVERSGGAWRLYGLSGRCWVSLPEGDHTREWPLAAGQMMTLTSGEPRMASLGRARAEDLQNAFLVINQASVQPVASAPPIVALTPPSVAMAARGNQWVATGLSTLLPGAGQLYAGELPRGLTYLGLEGALLGAGFYARAHGQDTWALGAAVGLAALNLLAPLDAYLSTAEPARAPAAR